MDATLARATQFLSGRGVQRASDVGAAIKDNRTGFVWKSQSARREEPQGLVAAARADARFTVGEWRGEPTLSLRTEPPHPHRGVRPPLSAAEKYEKRREEAQPTKPTLCDLPWRRAEEAAAAALIAARTAAALDAAAVWLRGRGVQRAGDLGAALADLRARVPRRKGTKPDVGIPRLTLASAARADARFDVGKWCDDVTIALRGETPGPLGARPPFTKVEIKANERLESTQRGIRERASALIAARRVYDAQLAAVAAAAAAGVAADAGVTTNTSNASGVAAAALPRLTEELATSDPAAYVALVEAAAAAPPAVALEIFRTSYSGMGTITQLGKVGGDLSLRAHRAVYALIVRAAEADARAVTRCFPKGCPGCVWLHLALPVALHVELDGAAGDAMRALMCDSARRIVEPGEVATLAGGLRAAWYEKGRQTGNHYARRAFPGYGVCTEFDDKFCLHVASRAGRLLTSESLRGAMRARGARADRAVRKVTRYLSEEREWESDGE